LKIAAKVNDPRSKVKSQRQKSIKCRFFAAGKAIAAFWKVRRVALTND
jgi:hypothetical protein